MGAFESQSRLAVFAGPDCTGTSRDWPADGFINGEKDNYPLDFMIDGINDDVSSFMVWESNKKIINGIDSPCRLRRN
ncbi:hypothetical protein BBJ28_00000715 [Nothophytophthora sp. Chile5]|nr:hypothetical protein BBJ28_00000715 [Nothophytophthora sp. Chile5]